ncbi:hypothetical protein [Alteromonas gracilis]|uniref:hypothetical protein n=1 Tax=Alteromonas gracilis TaxID=1479524 RepID=UPI00321AF88F
MKSWRFFPLVGFIIGLLSGCGGSGSDSPASPPTVDSPSTITIQGPQTANVGDSVDFVVAAPAGTKIDNITWTVTGIATSPLSSHTQAIGFDTTQSGDAVVNVDVTLDTGELLSDSTTLSVNETNDALAVVRLGHEASEGGRVSLSVDAIRLGNLEITDIEWEQTSGPQIPSLSFDSGEFSRSVYFQAPRVSADSVIAMTATLSLSNGDQLQDTAHILVKDIALDTEGFFVDNDGAAIETVTSHMQPYIADSPYADALTQCVYNNTVKNSCRFSTLPLIGQVTENPTIDDILDRTYVSHPWMGDAFKQFLETSQSQADMLNLLRATTAVVISYDIRPSFYWVATGAIYLDANNFWRTPEERDTLNTRPDYRSGFGNELSFSTTWRYTKDNAYYFPILTSFDPSDRLSRSDSEVEAALSWLMYHELAHANDFFDYTEWAQLSNSDSPLSAYNDTSPISTGLSRALPLNSVQLHAIAQVRYGGDDATNTQQNYTALQIARWFEQDGAVSFYSYFTEREDIATLFERFMMLHRLGVSADLGVFSRDAIDNGTFNISWGQRDRVNAPLVQPRVAYAVNRLLPNLNVPQIQANMPSPQFLPTGQSWRDTVSFAQSQQQLGNASDNSGDAIISETPTLIENTISIAEELKVVDRFEKR